MKSGSTTHGYIRLAVLIFLALMPIVPKAQVLQPGMDAVVTTYSFTPLSRPVAMVKRIGDPLGAGAPFVSGGNWVPPSIAPAINNWNATNMGQVFGTAIDAPGNVYFAATAMYYNVNTFPEPKVLADTTLTAASVSPTGFHSVNGSFGLIYKADASNLNTVSCIVTANATNAGAGIGTNKLYNTGYGIGNIAISTTYNKLYASNLEDGKIYCINPATGNVDYEFDPLIADNGVSGIVPIGERVFAVGVNNEFDGTTRLYYTVLKSNTNPCQSVVRSVQLTANGAFLPATDVEEIILPAYGDKTYFSDIAFSVRGEMLVAEKGGPHDAHVYQYYGRHNAWSTPQQIPVSDFNITMLNSGGGVDYGFMKDNKGTLICDSLIWSAENAMSNTKWYGIQSTPHNGYIPFSTTPFDQQTYVVDLDGIPGLSPYYVKGKFGDVEFFDSACKGEGPTDICSLVSLTAVKDSGSGCCYNIYVSNKYYAEYFTGIDIETDHLNIDNVQNGNTWGNIVYQSTNKVGFGDANHITYLPKDSASGGFLLAKICLSGTGPDILKVRWIGNSPQFDTVCTKNVDISGCGIPVDTNCVSLFNQKAVCENGVVTMQFQIKNNSSFTMRSVTIHSLNPNVKAANNFVPIADVPPGNTSPVYSVPLVVKNNDSVGCFFFSACDLNVFPGTSGLYPKFCCMDSIKYCVAIPHCDSCDAISITAEKSDSASTSCCYKLTLNNNMQNASITCLRFNGLNGSQFAIFSGWNIQSPVSSNRVVMCAPGSGLGNGTYPDFANFCITGTSTSPYQISVDFLDSKGNTICTKLLKFTNCDLVKPTCANIINDSLYCDGSKAYYSFYIKNNSTFPLYQVDLRLSDTTFKLDKYVIIPDTPILPGDMGGRYLISIDSPSSNETFCMYLTGHNNIYIPDSISATECCTDSLGVICLPFPNCDSTCCTNCCDFANMKIPTGITPNNDGYNDKFVIENSSVCTSVKITVFNRWGNIVYKDTNYNNKWEGTNTKGEKLPQGTYFVVIELANGSKKGTYIDIRY